MDLSRRVQVHAALGDPHRLRMVDELALGDRTFLELAAVVGLPGNAAAHHLDVLETAGLIDRRVSEGDHRRKYVRLRAERLDGLLAGWIPKPAVVLFVCTHNSARSQFAAALWRSRTGGAAESAGTTPADRVHPTAARVASELGLDLATASPKGYDALTGRPDLIVSVCDRAREAGLPFDAPSIHWSIPDPVARGTVEAFRSAFGEIAARVDRLASATH
jgi:protein-tyrosine-phosphatase